MAEEQVGTGYVLIKPKMDEGAKAGLENSGKASGHGFATSFQVAAGNLIASAVQSIAGIAVDTFSNAFSNYANYEQLVGGVETLFKESAGIVQQNAAAAFETAGLSANDYMEQVTSFSASLLQGLGGDTAKAAEYADMAIRDMSDNANKMGSSMESITNAYQGFAKQNYTMLDNLKLGYGGTKTEMERLLADASKIAGVEFNIDNYNDVIEAIHVMQESMGIAGTTSKEATDTISGSISKLQGAWQNFLTGLFDESADLGDLAEKLFSSLGDVFRNVVPRIGVLVTRLFTSLPDAIISAIKAIPSIVGPTISKVFGEEIGEQVTGYLEHTFGNVVKIIEGAVAIVKPIAETVIGFITNNLIPTIGMILEDTAPIVDTIVDIVTDAMPVIQGIVETAMNGIKGVISVVWPVISGIVEISIGIITGLIEGLLSLVGFVQGVFDGIKAAIEGPMNAAKDFVGGIIETIKGFFNFTVTWPHIPLPHPYISPSGWSVGDLLKGVIPSIGIDWYAKGGIIDGATLIGVGEAGPEAVVPLTQPNLKPFAQSVAEELGVQQIVPLLEQIAAKDDKIYLDGKTLVGGISSRMDAALGARQAMSARGLA